VENDIGDLTVELNSLYEQMPKTIGCIGCGKCCKIQHPHCYSIEFYNMLYLLDDFTEEQKINLHAACLSNYLDNSINKPCVFLGEDNKCKTYSCRDYNCRSFGIVPKKAYAKHVKAVKKNFPGIRLGLEKQSDCCGGVRPEEFIGAKKLDEIFNKIADLDRKLGIADKDVDDGTSYMTFHDHYLLFYYRENTEMLEKLTQIKYNCSEQEKKAFVSAVMELLKNKSGE